jgi:hypothetical protein
MLTVFLLLFSGFSIGFIASHLQYFIFKYAKSLSVVGRRRGYHFHHSMFGIGFYLLPFFVHVTGPQILFLYGIGSGLIADHTLKEGFIFITKESEDKFNHWFLSRHFLLIMPEFEYLYLVNNILDNAPVYSV